MKFYLLLPLQTIQEEDTDFFSLSLLRKKKKRSCVRARVSLYLENREEKRPSVPISLFVRLSTKFDEKRNEGSFFISHEDIGFCHRGQKRILFFLHKEEPNSQGENELEEKENRYAVLRNALMDQGRYI